MSAIVNETDQFDEVVQTPIIGDKFTYPALVIDALTKLADRTRWLKNSITYTETSATETVKLVDASNHVQDIVVPASTRLGSNPITTAVAGLLNNIVFNRKRIWGATTTPVAEFGAARYFPVPINPYAGANSLVNFVPGLDTPWALGGTAPEFFWFQNVNTGRPHMYFSVPQLPPMGVVNSFSATVRGGGGHAGVMPALKPSITLYKSDGINPSEAVAVANDLSASTPFYESQHDLSATFTEVLDRTTPYNYFFEVTGESGAGAQVGFKVMRVFLTFSGA